jgi:hypothetical protein
VDEIQTRGQLVKKQYTDTALAGLTLQTWKMPLHASLEGSHVVGERKYVSWEGISVIFWQKKVIAINFF